MAYTNYSPADTALFYIIHMSLCKLSLWEVYQLTRASQQSGCLIIEPTLCIGDNHEWSGKKRISVTYQSVNPIESSVNENKTGIFQRIIFFNSVNTFFFYKSNTYFHSLKKYCCLNVIFLLQLNVLKIIFNVNRYLVDIVIPLHGTGFLVAFYKKIEYILDQQIRRTRSCIQLGVLNYKMQQLRFQSP